MKYNDRECYGTVIYRDKEQNVINCRKCGFIHIHPFPAQTDLAEMYRERFYEDEKPEYITKFEREKDYWLAIYTERFEFVNQLVQTNLKRVLDIGSSIGYFLKAGKDTGWDVLGIEPSKSAAEYAENLGIETLNEQAENINFQNIGKFSFIHMSFVLEHIFYPEKLIENCYKILETGGIICIEVPNEFNPLQDILVNNLGKPYYWITTGNTPHHLNYFNKESLCNLLNKCGFDIVYETATFPMEFFVLMGDDYIGNDITGSQSHIKRMNFEKNLLKGNQALKKNLYEHLADMGIGREVVIFGRKN